MPAGTARGCCQAYDAGRVHFVPSVEVKVSYMSAGRVGVLVQYSFAEIGVRWE